MDMPVRLMQEYNMTVVTQPNAIKYYEVLSAFDVTSSEILDIGSYVLDWEPFTLKSHILQLTSNTRCSENIPTMEEGFVWIISCLPGMEL
jgi:hypothetical protein